MVSRIIIGVLLCSLLGGCWENYHPLKEVRYKDARITWYFRYVGDNRRDFVEVSKGSDRELVLECFGTPITDIKVVNDSIVIKTLPTDPSSILQSKGSGLGIPVLIDQTGSEYEWDTLYNHEQYVERRKNIKIQFDNFNSGNLIGKISYLYTSSGAVRVRLSDADESYLFVPLMIPLNDYAHFDSVAQIEDSVYKPAFADTLILIKVVTKKIYKFTFKPPT
jgi:hypothetical protein